MTYYHDIPLGLYVVRGDSVVLLGEVRDDDGGEQQLLQQGGVAGGISMKMKEVTLDELAELEAESRRRRCSGGGRDNDEPLNWDFDSDLIA